MPSLYKEHDWFVTATSSLPIKKTNQFVTLEKDQSTYCVASAFVDQSLLHRVYATDSKDHGWVYRWVHLCKLNPDTA